MKRICDIAVGDMIMYHRVWYTVKKKTADYFHVQANYESGGKLIKKLPVNSREYVQWQAAKTPEPNDSSI